MSPALTFEEMSGNSKRYLEASGEWELVDILGETSILKFGIDEWDIITFWVRRAGCCFSCSGHTDHYLEPKQTLVLWEHRAVQTAFAVSANLATSEVPVDHSCKSMPIWQTSKLLSVSNLNK